jgi:hypothetical protein
MSCFLIRILIKSIVPSLIYKGSYIKENMRILITIFLLAHFVFAFSQITGTRFTKDSALYRESGYYLSGGSGTTLQHHYFYKNKYIFGDTIINNKFYQVVYYDNKTNFDTVCLGTKHFMYYENRQLIFDTLMVYDFNLNLADTFNLYVGPSPFNSAGFYPVIVTQVDSIFLGNKWRKRIYLYRANLVNAVWVEGIGDINKGLNTDYGYVSGLSQAMGAYGLSCFSENFQPVYGNGCTAAAAVCTLVGIEENTVTQDLINIYPNPTSQELSIEIPSEIKLKQIKVIDITGKEFPLSYSSEGDTYKINLANFTSGLYFIEVITEKGVVRKKLVVQK